MNDMRNAKYVIDIGAIPSLPARSPGSVDRPTLATREKGERLYKMICERIATRVLGAPTP